MVLVWHKEVHYSGARGQKGGPVLFFLFLFFCPFRRALMSHISIVCKRAPLSIGYEDEDVGVIDRKSVMESIHTQGIVHKSLACGIDQNRAEIIVIIIGHSIRK